MLSSLLFMLPSLSFLPVQAAALCSHHGLEREGDIVVFRRGAFADVKTLPAALEPHLVDAKHSGSYGEVGGAEGGAESGAHTLCRAVLTNARGLVWSAVPPCLSRLCTEGPSHPSLCTPPTSASANTARHVTSASDTFSLSLMRWDQWVVGGCGDLVCC